MEEPNPYAAPSSNLESADSYGQNEGVTRGVVAELTGTKGWARFISILAALFGILMLFAGIGGSIMAQRSLQAFDLGYLPAGLFGGIMILVAAVAITYGVLLSGFSGAVNRLLRSGEERDLADALRKQKTFWMFWGIVSAIFTALSLFGLLSR